MEPKPHLNSRISLVQKLQKGAVESQQDLHCSIHCLFWRAMRMCKSEKISLEDDCNVIMQQIPAWTVCYAIESSHMCFDLFTSYYRAQLGFCVPSPYACRLGPSVCIFGQQSIEARNSQNVPFSHGRSDERKFAGSVSCDW